jgi:hypothetical protein
LFPSTAVPVVPIPGTAKILDVDSIEKDQEEKKYTETILLQSAFCRYQVIVSELMLWLRSKGTGIPPLAFAFSKYSRLLKLVDDLPESITQTDDSSNPVMIFL